MVTVIERDEEQKKAKLVQVEIATVSVATPGCESLSGPT